MAIGTIGDIRGLVDAGFTWAVGAADDLDQAKLRWWYVGDNPLVGATKRLQVRDKSELAPAYEVSMYKQMLKAGKHLPPVYVTMDGWLVDGNTRTEAAIALGWVSYPALVIAVNWQDLSPDSEMRKKLLKLGGAQNQKHGRRMSAAAMAALIEQVTDDMSSPKMIATEMNISVSTATTVMNAAKVRRRAAELGIDIDRSLSNSHMKLLGGKLEKWTTPVFEAILNLTQQAHLTIPDVDDVAKKVEALGTEQERLALLKEIADQYRTTIRSGHRESPSKARRLKQTLGYLLSEANAPKTLTELDPDRGQDYRNYILRAELKLHEIRLAQEEIENSRKLPAEWVK